MKYLLALTGLFLMGFTPNASTTYISAPADSTMDVAIQGGARFVYVKTQCAHDLYFRFTARDQIGSETAKGLGDGYPLRLASTDDAFVAPFSVTSIGASYPAGACTFTSVLGL